MRALDIGSGAKTMLLWSLRNPQVFKLHQQVMIGRPHGPTWMRTGVITCRLRRRTGGASKRWP